MQEPFRADFQLSSGGLPGWLRQRFHGDGARPLSVWRQILLAVGLLWLPLAGLTVVAGTFFGDTVALPFLKDVVPQVRLLIALPLLLMADGAIDPALNTVVGNLDESGVIPEDAKPQYRDALLGLENGRDAVTPDVMLLVLAFVLSWLLHPGYEASGGETLATSWRWSITGGNAGLSMAGIWHALVSAPIFQFVLFRWVWRFLIWAYFLFRVSRLPLALHPTHPDLSGGLGIVGLGQQTFTIVFVAFAAVMSSTIASNILVDGASFRDSRPEIIVFVAASVVALYAPLLFFTGKMYRSRRGGLSQYGALGQHLSDAFSTKWLKGTTPADVGTELKDSADSSTMADYGATFDAVRNMRVLPLEIKGIVAVAAALLLPFLPLYLTEFSVMDLLQRMADALV